MTWNALRVALQPDSVTVLNQIYMLTLTCVCVCVCTLRAIYTVCLNVRSNIPMGHKQYFFFFFLHTCTMQWRRQFSTFNLSVQLEKLQIQTILFVKKYTYNITSSTSY